MSAVTKLMTPGGGGVALTPASSIASDVTVNVPSQNCTLDIQGPAFSAYQSSVQSIANATLTKVQFQTEEYDTANCFDNATNYRFTPNVAGYYKVSGVVAVLGAILVTVYKNGSEFKRGFQAHANGIVNAASVSCDVYLNGSTDYIELYVYQANGAAQNTTANSYQTYFQASMVRAA